MDVVVEKKEDNHLSYFIGYHFALAARMQSGWLWCCWGKPVGETVESEDAVGGNAVGETVGCEDAVGVSVVLLGGTCRGDCGAVGRNAVGESVELLGGMLSG